MTDARTTLMFAEAAEAGEAVRRALHRNSDAFSRAAELLSINATTSVITCARGSSDHAATYAKYALEIHCGLPVSSAALSVNSIYQRDLNADHFVCLIISQSGRSQDILSYARSAKKSGWPIIALVNDEETPLKGLADIFIPLSAGVEKSVAATKSYISSLACIAAIAAKCSGEPALLEKISTLPDYIDNSFALDWTKALKLLSISQNMFVLGRGPSFGIAQEAALKLKETSGIHAEAYSSAEVRHGPMRIVNANFPVIGFAVSDASGDDVLSVAEEFQRRSASVLIAATQSEGLPVLLNHPLVEPIGMITSFYKLAAQVACERGMDPDRPPFLSKVTSTV